MVVFKKDEQSIHNVFNEEAKPPSIFISDAVIDNALPTVKGKPLETFIQKKIRE